MYGCTKNMAHNQNLKPIQVPILYYYIFQLKNWVIQNKIAYTLIQTLLRMQYCDYPFFVTRWLCKTCTQCKKLGKISIYWRYLGSLCHSIEVQKICLCLHKLNKVLNKYVAGWRRRDRARGRGLTHRSSLEPRSASSVTATAMQHPRPLWRRGGRTSSAAHPPHSHTSLATPQTRSQRMIYVIIIRHT